MYEDDWDKDEKFSELQDDDTRLIIAYCEPRPGVDGQTTYSHPGPCGFMHFRFLVEEGVEVLYIYELQVIPSKQRKVTVTKWSHHTL